MFGKQPKVLSLFMADTCNLNNDDHHNYEDKIIP